MRALFPLFFCLLLAAPMAPAAAIASSIEAQRAWFYEAREAFNAGDMEHYSEVRSHLNNYPLTPYLELWEAAKGLEKGHDRMVGKALERYAYIPEAIDLKIAWIRNLADRGQWPQIAAAIEKSPPVADRLPEIAMLALWYTGQSEEALRQYGERWASGEKLSKMTFQLQQNWLRAGHPDRNELWQRINHFVRRGNWQEVQSLQPLLSYQDRACLKRWRAMQQEPLQTLTHWRKSDGGYIAAAMILNDGLQRLSSKDPVAAWDQLHRLEPLFDPGRFNLMQRSIALQGARQHRQDSAAWLDSLPATMQTDTTRAWEVRVHLIHGEWFKALKGIKALPDDEQTTSRWSYWRARSLEALGMTEEATALYEKTARGRGYYSFMSAEHLNKPYDLGSSRLTVSKLEMIKLERVAAMQRAHEWWRLGEAGLALREWSMAMGNASKARWKAAAELASEWQWHDRVIQAAYMSGEIDALERRFPVAYRKVVAEMSDESGLPSSLIWSIIRQESAFNAQAISRSGARGLMQLMPATAKEVATRNDIESPDLFDPEDNIKLGALYLSRLVERFGNNRALAAAAYNAGPHRVAKWLEQQPFAQADVWIESIPFDETRRYVQQVLAFTVVYDWRQSRQPAGIVTQIAMNKDEG